MKAPFDIYGIMLGQEFDQLVYDIIEPLPRSSESHVFPWRLTPSLEEPDLGMLP